MKFEETNPETNPNFPWVVYTSGADEDSLDDQEARCRKVARDILGITNEPARVWRETITENDADRPALEDMLQGAGSGEFRDLIVPSPNQLSGDVGEFVDICNRLNNAWIRVHFAEGPRSDFPDVGLLPYLRNIMDMQQREELSRRIRRGLEHSARQGRLPTGTAPFGYYYDPNTRSRKVNETEAERARHMFRMASDGMTSGEIARTLNREGVTARHGKRWTKRAVTRILRRRSVVGIDCWKHIRIDTFTPPIVDKTLFDQVQEKLEGNREVPNPLSGRIRCGGEQPEQPLPAVRQGPVREVPWSDGGNTLAEGAPILPLPCEGHRLQATPHQRGSIGTGGLELRGGSHKGPSLDCRGHPARDRGHDGGEKTADHRLLPSVGPGAGGYRPPWEEGTAGGTGNPGHVGSGPGSSWS